MVDVHSKVDRVFKGMVEKWLLQVEKLMLSSVRHVIHQGLLNYKEVRFQHFSLELSVDTLKHFWNTLWTIY